MAAIMKFLQFRYVYTLTRQIYYTGNILYIDWQQGGSDTL